MRPSSSARACDQVHHRECWTDVGGCATYGCENAPKSEKTAPAEAPRSAWGDTKKCPACGEKIKSIALRCRYCGTEFDTVDPLTLKDLRGQVAKEERLQAHANAGDRLVRAHDPGLSGADPGDRRTLLCPAQTQTIAKAGPTYLVMGYSAIGDLPLIFDIAGPVLPLLDR